MKKSYNPFKMWGSYIGAFIGFMIPFNCHTLPGFFLPYKWECLTPYFPHIIQLSILGFLLGWGIHSLVRALRK